MQKFFFRRYLAYSRNGFFAYVNTFFVIFVCTLINFALLPLVYESNLMMVYLLGVIVISLQGARMPALFASIFSVLGYNFFFVPPFFSLYISDMQYFFTLIVMLLVLQIVSLLTVNLRWQGDIAKSIPTKTSRD